MCSVVAFKVVISGLEKLNHSLQKIKSVRLIAFIVMVRGRGEFGWGFINVTLSNVWETLGRVSIFIPKLPWLWLQNYNSCPPFINALPSSLLLAKRLNCRRSLFCRVLTPHRSFLFFLTLIWLHCDKKMSHKSSTLWKFIQH